MVKAKLLEVKYPVMLIPSRGKSLIPLFWCSREKKKHVPEMSLKVGAVEALDSYQKHSVIHRSEDTN